MADSINTYIKEINESVTELTSETGSPTQAFTKYVLDKMCDKANLGEAVECYAVIRNDAGDKRIGEINGYAISVNGETVSLFYTLYEPTTDENPKSITSDDYNTAITRLQGYYVAALNGRCNRMEPSSRDLEICKHIYENDNDITSVRLFVITNGTIKTTFKTPKQRIDDSKSFGVNHWDISRLYTILHDGMDHLSVDIDLLDDEDYKFDIPFIKMSSAVESYQTYIAMLPGQFLYNLYENYNTDLLQSNVRFFKGGKNNCNKGIYETLRTKPHRFLAYNNGITATAKAVLAQDKKDEPMGFLRYIENFQILNGGQTTASIYYAKKNDPQIDLSNVYVQMKLIVLNENTDEIHPLITKYSNTQSNVTPSDYSTNNPFNLKLQELSRSRIAPDRTQSGVISYWYYERVSGQYEQDVNRRKTKVEKEKFKSENPSNHKFDKCELGIVNTTWQQKPDVAINGPQKCYKAFIEGVKNTVPDNLFFENSIALLILHRYMAKNNPVFAEYHQVRSQMCIYTLAMLYHVTNGNLSLYKIWENQELSDNLKKFINEFSKQLFNKLREDQPETTTFRDYCKSPKTWEATKKYTFDLDFSSIKDDMKSPGEDEYRSNSSAERDESERRSVEELGVAFWDGLYKMNRTDIFIEPECISMSEICNTLKSKKQLTQVQVYEGLRILQKFETSGLTIETVIANSDVKVLRKDKNSKLLYERLQRLTEEDWSKIKKTVGRVCDEDTSTKVKKIADKKDKSKLKFEDLVMVCAALDKINKTFKEQMPKLF